jgi:hypothetical protein
MLLAESRLLNATERKIIGKDVGGVGANDTGFQAFAESHQALQVACIDVSGQAGLCAIGLGQDLFFTIEFVQAGYRPENSVWQAGMSDVILVSTVGVKKSVLSSSCMFS